jgi:hypothetical protein
LKDDNDGDEVDIVTGEKVGVNREIEELSDALYACCELEKKEQFFYLSFISVFFPFLFLLLSLVKTIAKSKTSLSFVILTHLSNSLYLKKRM